MTIEVKKFDAEVGKVLHMMIHSIYTNKEICLRELISNASDACDKLRYLAQQNERLMQNGDADLKIVISIDKNNRHLIIEDNGIGMDKDELSENLGTIARSGTQNFIEKLSGDAKKDNMLIGQFGVGFYSSYMVADSVTVLSTKAGQEKTSKWFSSGDGEYTIEDHNEGNWKQRGTKIILHIKEDENEFLDHFRIKNIIKNYSDHISVPIFFRDESGNEIKVNSSSALWSRQKNEITEEEYNTFYKSIAYSADNPWIIMHNKNEGVTEFTNLLFIPSTKTFDLFHPDRKRRVKLYIKRVFISDENVDIVPYYLRFLRGVVDSNDLPLNISRETLQHNSIISKIKDTITKRVLSEFRKKMDVDRESYESFWKNFGAAIKEGLCEMTEDHEKILDSCLFYSFLQNKMISLDEYIQSIKSEQKYIYYLSGENIDQLKQSPQIEWFASNNIDVLFFTDHVDDFWCNVANKYKSYELRSVTRVENEEIKNDSLEEHKEKSQDFNNLVEYFKSVLKDSVKDVVISNRLTESPVRLVVAENAMNMRMERFLVEQKQLQSSSAKILELNPNNSIILNINNNINQSDDIVKILFDQACLIEGESIKDPVDFCKRVNKLIQTN